ncbi:molybdopterin guanine dinucleotide biosynthesis protein MoaE [Arenicella chitinivorans]|uniref:Molybdopterin synthase catalytic subunit n=1 Tax=Arenicella chitinivorans TaxID=1329800 RepID=A0A918RPA1_9GAMM|nr:molybdenum cofactor biosynthesis protein MoaE [Arenicella chitinivorans]GHA07043.1 molybdopterin guanine dinucleotide biosynthesis protein MoaE [Arenicella chitinivorans]
MFEIVDSPFEPEPYYQKVRVAAPHAGALVMFTGLVRDLYQVGDDAQITHLELEHYPGMTESICESIITEAMRRFEIDHAHVVHRVGKILANEHIVLVLVAASHRRAAFDAAQYIMDFLKTDAPFWKKEVGARGTHWLGLKRKDQQAAQRWQNLSTNHDSSHDKQ